MATSGSSRVPPNPETLEQVAKESGGEFFAAPDAEGLSRVYEELGSRLGTRKEDREITDVFAALAAGLLADRRHDVGLSLEGRPVRPCAPYGLSRSSPRPWLLLLPPGLPTSATGCRCAFPSPAHGSSCLRRQRSARPRVEYQLTCPRGHVVGGLDARLSVRGIDVLFLGRLGSPVNPGITTSRSAVFAGHLRGSVGSALRRSVRSSAACRPPEGARACRPRSAQSGPGSL